MNKERLLDIVVKNLDKVLYGLKVLIIQVEYDKSHKWIYRKWGKKKDVACCSVCWEKDRVLVSLKEEDNGWGSIYYKCDKCGARFKKEKNSVEIPQGLFKRPKLY